MQNTVAMKIAIVQDHPFGYRRVLLNLFESGFFWDRSVVENNRGHFKKAAVANISKTG